MNLKAHIGFGKLVELLYKTKNLFPSRNMAHFPINLEAKTNRP